MLETNVQMDQFGDRLSDSSFKGTFSSLKHKLILSYKELQQNLS